MRQLSYFGNWSLENKNNLLIDEINKMSAEYSQRREFVSKNKSINKN